MSREIFLPELLSINIKNYSLYPNGLDYTYDFVKGVNLILGGNGMGKTTFVNIIRFGLIGLYKRAKDLTRTYRDRAIVKRLLYPSSYFSSRKDDSLSNLNEATVILKFKIRDVLFEVNRSLDSGCLLNFSVNGVLGEGLVIEESVYEDLHDNIKCNYLLYQYETQIKKYSNLMFDDLIFFVNEILFFGENHNTVLWNKGIDGKTDVQNELFNKYFNEPSLDLERQELLRQAKYYDSLSRHRSEDIRVINRLVEKIRSSNTNDKDLSPSLDIVDLKNEIDKVKEKLENIKLEQNGLNSEISILHGEINRQSMQASVIDENKKRLEKKINSLLWETLHPQYDVFVKNIQINHICPMCNKKDSFLFNKINDSSTNCFLCGSKIHQTEDSEVMSEYKQISNEHRAIYQSIANKQRKIKVLEERLLQLDRAFQEIDLHRRSLLQQLRELQYKRASLTEPDKLQAMDDERNIYEKEKIEFQKKSSECAKKAQQLTIKIEEEILANVAAFSSIFSSYAEQFLGVPCSLEYHKYDSDTFNRFYPVIGGKVRRQDESLSESQRFFIDHAFRMSILSFFYKTPSFYIVETPDSSLDLSYEQNAASVFLKFLEHPNIVIITSNLNNSSFLNYLIESDKVPFSMVGLPDIAKKSAIQKSNENLLSIFNKIKSRI